MPSPVRDTVSVTEMNGDTKSPSVLLDVMPSQPGDGCRKPVSPYGPDVQRSEPRDSGSCSDKAVLPEIKITLFALRLAILEKVASRLGELAFIWATVVVLGGFAVTLETVDFWFITILLLIEGTRIFSRSQEVEWHRETMLTSMTTLNREAKRLSRGFCNAGNFILRKFFRCLRSNNSRENSGVDHDDLQKRIWCMSKVRLLFWLQLLSASTCVGLSLYRLVRQHYSVDSSSDTKNLKPALKIFYGLSLAESFLFLLEKAYWQWKIIAGKLLTKVNDEYGFDQSELDTVQRFLYDTYSRCVNGSVFDGLKMEFVSHSVELLQSSSVDGQLTGARVLSKLASNKQFAEKTLRAIGTMRDVVERLIDMLNFKNDHEQDIRKAAAQIISKLVENKRDCIRVTAIAGLMESIASLLYSNDSSPGGFVLLGLTILQKLAQERSNHDKIGSCRGLLPKIIALTDLKPNALEFQIDRVKPALQIVNMLASTTGSRGMDLRKGIREIVFAISNLRNVLQYTEISTHCLQILAIETLTSLAREQEGRESIGGTGGVLHNLFSLFFMERNNNNDEKEELVNKAGEALGFLSLENEHNCEIMMSIKLDGHQNLIARLISVLNDNVQGIHVARILRNLLTYAKSDYVKLTENALAEQVLKFVRENHSCEHQEADKKLEANIGFAAQFFKIMTKSNFDHVFEESSGVTKESLICKLVEVFRSHPYPSKAVPNIRRFSIELLIAVMERDKAALEKRSELLEALAEALEKVMNTTSDWEYYSAFSGSVGLSRHSTPIRSLAQSAMKLLHTKM